MSPEGGSWGTGWTTSGQTPEPDPVPPRPKVRSSLKDGHGARNTFTWNYLLIVYQPQLIRGSEKGVSLAR